jgi:DNA repair exonuclease SbcCD ATPase subunit
MFGDVHVTKRVLRWRTALILRELEGEVEAEQEFAPHQLELERLMNDKQGLEQEQARLRLCMQRLERGHTVPLPLSAKEITARLREVRASMDELDLHITPLARRAGELGNARWGLLMRAGNDKSRLARQIERYADVYTSRVSNLQALTPFGYLRARRGSLPHDDA